MKKLEEKKEINLFSDETLDSIAMAEIYGGAESNSGCSYTSYCPVQQCNCPSYDVCCAILG
jgi:hypothetical protein